MNKMFTGVALTYASFAMATTQPEQAKAAEHYIADIPAQEVTIPDYVAQPKQLEVASKAGNFILPNFVTPEVDFPPRGFPPSPLEVLIDRAVARMPIEPVPQPEQISEPEPKVEEFTSVPMRIQTPRQEYRLAAHEGLPSLWMDLAGIWEKDAAYIVIFRESTWRPGAENSIGCIALGQACSVWQNGVEKGLKPVLLARCFDWAKDPVCQLQVFDEYVIARYGSWQAALNHHYAKGWY